MSGRNKYALQCKKQLSLDIKPYHSQLSVMYLKNYFRHLQDLDMLKNLKRYDNNHW
jgi:hypothetical protein